MSNFIPTPLVARCSLRFTLFGESVVNTIWFKGAANFAEGDLGDLCAALKNWWENEMKPLQVSDLVLQETRAYDMSSENGPVFSLIGGTAGDLVAPGLPGQNAVTVTFRTPYRGRSGRGRNYVSGIAETDVDGNTVDATLRSNLADAYASLNTYVATINDAEHVVVSNYQDNAPRNEGFPQPVTTYVARFYIHVIRKRSSPQ